MMEAVLRISFPYFCPFCSSRLPRSASRCFFCEHPLPVYKGRPASSRRHTKAGQKSRETPQLPTVHIPVEDFASLRNIAQMAISDVTVSKLLLSELERAIVCSENLMPHGIVRMGSQVLMQRKRNDRVIEEISGVLVYPKGSSSSVPPIPVSSPLGAAILGLQSGASMPYGTADGALHVVTIGQVTPYKPNAASPHVNESSQSVLRGGD